MAEAVDTQPEAVSVSRIVACADGFAVEWELPQLAMLT
jgi:hypothetical protein